jgi:WD40-like Beta Propeller Repeat
MFNRIVAALLMVHPHKETSMKRNLCSAVFTLAALILLGPAAHTPATAQIFSAWSAPVNLGPTINSASTDFGPAISRDGLSLYISSNRDGGFGGFDLWVSQRASVNDPWGPPVNVGLNINSSVDEILPNVSPDGHLIFFSTNRLGGIGDFDIWVSRRANPHDDFGWQPPVNLGPGINTAAFEAAPHYFEKKGCGVPELFFTSGRAGGLGGFDSFVSSFAPEDNDDDSGGHRVVGEGSFRLASLVFELSSPQRDARPNLRDDGLEIFFYSDRPDSIGGSLDLWTSMRETCLDAWSTPVNLGSTVNSEFVEQHPTLSCDGETLIFSSNRPGGFGLSDLYMITRTKLEGLTTDVDGKGHREDNCKPFGG